MIKNNFSLDLSYLSVISTERVSHVHLFMSRKRLKKLDVSPTGHKQVYEKIRILGCLDKKA